MTDSQLQLEMELGHLDRVSREDALQKLTELLTAGQVALVPELPIVNLHSHTSYSFNAYDYSPSALAWEAKKRGLYAIGIMDHEVLTGVEEFLGACDLLAIRGLGGIETRVFIPEWRHCDINMPGEPGVFGFLGTGFTTADAPKGSHAERLLEHMFSSSQKRNETLVQKLNAYLRDLTVDYRSEVAPLVPPGGNATERHILRVLDGKSRHAFPDPTARARFWADAMSLETERVGALLDQPADLQLLIRAKLMKHGGPCYVAEGAETFPTLAESVQMMLEMGGIPVAGWLDGMSEGERDAGAFLDLMVAHGIPAVSIIPDRNWNLPDGQQRETKVHKLHEIIAEAAKREMLALVGTDMSKAGQKFVDDFHAEALAPFAQDFLWCAQVMTGHTRMTQCLGIGLLSDEVGERFGGRTKTRNAFFARLGQLPPPRDADERTALVSKIEQEWARGIPS